MSFISNRAKKILLRSLIVLLTIFQLLFLLTGVISIVGDEDGQGLQTAGTFLFVIILFGFCLWWAIRQLKTLHRVDAKSEITSIDHETSPGHVIRVESQLGLAEYRKLMLTTTFTRPIVLYLYFIGLTIIGLSLAQSDYNWFMLFFLIFLLYLPISVTRSANANYKSSKAIHETITYEFTSDTIASTGTTFKTTVTWDSLYKTQELKDWILLYTNKHLAMFIPKQGFTSEEDLKIFKGYCERVR